MLSAMHFATATGCPLQDPPPTFANAQSESRLPASLERRDSFVPHPYEWFTFFHCTLIVSGESIAFLGAICQIAPGFKSRRRTKEFGVDCS